MAETSDEIRRELEDTRARVGGTIAALERKVNPRHILDDYPLVVVGAAFGVGVLAATSGAGKRAAYDVRSKIQHSAHNMNSSAGSSIDRVIHSITDAGMAALTTKFTELVDSFAQSTQSKPKPNNTNALGTRAA